MRAKAATIFETAIGRCGIAWSLDRIVGVEVGNGDDAETRYRVQQRFPVALQDDVPPFIAEAISKIQALLNGQAIDFDGLPLDFTDLPDLNRRVYEIILRLRPGQTTTYGTIARELGDVSMSQAVGYALGKNPFPIIVPCHRVLGANGKVGGFSASGGTATKIRMLNIEQACLSNTTDLFGGLPLQEKPTSL